MLKTLQVLCGNGLIVGIISGIISSIIVTQGYRMLDKKRERFLYLNRIYIYIKGLRSKLSMYENGEISDEYIVNIYNYLVQTELPKKESWVRLHSKEKKVTNDFKKLFENTQRKVYECKFDIDSIKSGKDDLRSSVDKLKNEVIIYAMKAFRIETELASIVREYYKY